MSAMKSLRLLVAAGFLFFLTALEPSVLRAQSPQNTTEEQRALIDSIRELKSQISELRQSVTELRAEAAQYRAETIKLRGEVEAARAQGQPAPLPPPAQREAPGADLQQRV